MRGLFLGIALMTAGLLALGALRSGEAPTAQAPAKMDGWRARPEPAPRVARPGAGPAMGAPDSAPQPVGALADDARKFEGRAARDESAFGDDGKDDKPSQPARSAAKIIGPGSGGGAARPAPRPSLKAKAERAPEVIVPRSQLTEIELVEVEEELEVAADGDGVPADQGDLAPPPPPAVTARPEPAKAPRTVAFAFEDLPVEGARASDKDTLAGKRAGRPSRRGMPAAAPEPPRERADRGGAPRGLDNDQPLPARLDLSLFGEATAQGAADDAPPDRFLPRMCYFENTYLGGNAAWQEQLRRVRAALGELGPLRHARLDAQAFDPPADAGMALTASLDHAGLQQPGRVVLQVGLQGSQRYGWRRPPLDVVLVIDGPATDLTQAAAKALLARLSPRDRLGVIEAGAAQPLAPVADLRSTRDALVDVELRPPGGAPADLVGAMDQAGALLKQAANNAARIPGSQTVVLLTRDSSAHAQAARAAAHRLQTQGAVVSVVDLGAAADAGWWAVANAGHGNFHRATGDTLGDAFDAELAMLSKVVARLLRLNVRLGPHTEGVRVIGSRILGQREVKEVKAREVATDRNLSKTMGVKANRGDDDDGIQTVIPYFYGGDSHVVLIELWVDPSKASLESAVAEISLKYKDMVNLDNATARAAVFLARRPKADTRAQHLVKANLEGFAFAAALDRASEQAARGDWSAVRQTLRDHAHHPRDRRVAQAFEALIGQQSPARLQQALALASRQRKGTSNGVQP